MVTMDIHEEAGREMQQAPDMAEPRPGKAAEVIHYLLTTVWGFATPALMGWGAQAALEYITSGSERMGHSTPVEYFMLFILIGGLCFGAFLLYDFVYALVFLPMGRKKRGFFYGLLLYILVCLGGWLVVGFLAVWIKSLFG